MLGLYVWINKKLPLRKKGDNMRKLKFIVSVVLSVTLIFKESIQKIT